MHQRPEMQPCQMHQPGQPATYQTRPSVKALSLYFLYFGYSLLSCTNIIRDFSFICKHWQPRWDFLSKTVWAVPFFWKLEFQNTFLHFFNKLWRSIALHQYYNWSFFANTSASTSSFRITHFAIYHWLADLNRPPSPKFHTTHGAQMKSPLSHVHPAERVFLCAQYSLSSEIWMYLWWWKNLMMAIRVINFFVFLCFLYFCQASQTSRRVVDAMLSVICAGTSWRRTGSQAEIYFLQQAERAREFGWSADTKTKTMLYFL